MRLRKKIAKSPSGLFKLVDIKRVGTLALDLLRGYQNERIQTMNMSITQ